jgi:hypothetical protein
MDEYDFAGDIRCGRVGKASSAVFYLESGLDAADGGKKIFPGGESANISVLPIKKTDAIRTLAQRVVIFET